MNNKNKKITGSRKKAIVGVVLLVLFVALAACVAFRYFSKDKTDISTTNDKTTSTAQTAQSNFSDGGSREVISNNREEGVAVDTNGQVPVVPSNDKWASSSDNMIVAYSPSQDSLVKPKDTIYGVSSYQKVGFRLIDDFAGVIATGELNVVEGKFSGVLDFSTKGVNGRLDLFSSAEGGVEVSNVSISIRYK